MPGVPLTLAVTTLVCFLFSHARLRVRAAHPAFPTPSFFWREVGTNLGRIAPRECGRVFGIETYRFEPLPSYPAQAGYPVRCGFSVLSLPPRITGSPAFAG